jgi:hypothetical protein
MMDMLDRVTTLMLAGVLAVPAGAAAQTVTGSVVEAGTAAPLPGVLVSLLDDRGERVRAVLSDEAGRFAMEIGRFGRYRLRAERIGLETTTSRTFDLFTTNPHVQRVLMGERPVLIEGVVVDSRVQQCRLDPARGAQIQRWWQDVRTALDVSTVVQVEGLAQFELERFEREWDVDLRRIVAQTSRSEMNLSNRPFVSEEAEFLADGGFVQGDVMGQREYYAPDAEVLLSDVFLSSHCFSISDERDDQGLVGLAFEPTLDRAVPDITGTLWVDSTTAELQSLDFRYANLAELRENESGGYVSFDYLGSGAWIVGDWYIRMPKLGLRGGEDETLVLLGYVDVGGRVSPLEVTSVSAAAEDLGAVGSIRGVVHDSIRGRGLADATVVVIGTRFQTRTDATGAFVLPSVPVGEHQVTFFHDDPSAWGLGSPFLEVVVSEGRSAEIELALPGFRRAALIVCSGVGTDAQTVLVGDLVGADEQGLGNVEMEVHWEERDRRGVVLRTRTQELRTGSDGRFVACTLPSETLLRVRARVNVRWIDGFEVTLPHHDIAYRKLMAPSRD